MDDTMLRMMRLAGKGYSCSQIIILLGLEMRGENNPGLVRAMAGLAYGCGTERGACGVLTGACCLIALYAGKGDDEENESKHLLLMLEELTEWFETGTGCTRGETTCEAIVGDAGPAASRQTCGALVADTYTRVMEILTTHGIDPTHA